ncbi:MAG: Gfo/Idh/MocA family protein [Pyrinomonadaceae bacterium]
MRIGIIGCGGIGALRAAALRRHESCRLVAASDVNQERARELAARHGAAVEEDWRTLVSRDYVDAVIVCTPPHLHAEMCVEALRAGKHVLCEKPLARTPEECEAILRAARESGRTVATGFNYRFYPSVLKAREVFDSGVIGELDHVRSYAGYSATDHNHDWLHDVEIMGGGALRDNGIHLIDLTCYFLGEVAEVKGFALNSVWGFRGCEDNGFALLRSEAGRVASLQASWTEWKGYRFLVEIYGTRGCIRASCFPMLTQVTWSDKPGGRTRKKTHLFPMTHVQERLRSYRWVVVQSFVRELDAFARAVRGETTPLATGGDGLRAVRVAHEVVNPVVNPSAQSAPRTAPQTAPLLELVKR